MGTCPKCGRPHRLQETRECAMSRAAYCYVVHDYYGCDSGCCGHRAYLCDAAGNILEEQWAFIHPYGAEKDSWAAEYCGGIWPGIEVRLSECAVSED